MNVDEHDLHPWLVREKQFIRRVIDRGVPLLGVCLGGQLIATVLGGQVTKNRQKEIGWFPVTLTSEAAASPLFARFPQQVPAFHWHGDTFSIPPGAVRLAASDGCDNQAFQYGRNVVALQFHWDYSQPERGDDDPTLRRLNWSPGHPVGHPVRRVWVAASSNPPRCLPARNASARSRCCSTRCSTPWPKRNDEARMPEIEGNAKSEARNSKQIQIRKTQMTETGAF